MKIFLLICLASGLASSEKLDRSYLPPPGSKFSGGSPGDIETPLEFPKQPSRPLPGNGKPEIELGIDRRPAPPSGIPDGQKPGFNYFQKSYPVPKTTTSYAITQTTTFAPDDEYTVINQPSGFLNRSTVQSSLPAQNQPIRRPGQSPYNQYRPGQDPSTVAPYGTTSVFNGPEYLPPVSNKQSPTQVISDQDGSGYPSGLPQGPKYQDGPAISANQNQYDGNQNIPSTTSPSYQGGRFVPSGPGSQQPQNQFPGSQFPSSTAAPQYQYGQRLITPGSNQQNQFTGSQFPSSTAAPQYQDGQRLITPGSNQQSQFSSNQGFPTSTAAPQYQFGQRFTTPAQQNLFTGNQYQGNQNFPSSSSAFTPGSIDQSQFTGNQNFPSTAAPNYQNGQRFTTPSPTQGALIPSQPDFGSAQSQNQFAGQNFPSTPSTPQFQDGVRLTTPGHVQEAYGSPMFTQQNQNQYPGNQIYPSSTAPHYRNGQQFVTSGPIGNQKFPSTAAPNYQYEGQYVPEQQRPGSRVPGQQGQSQFLVNQNYPSSTTAPQYQDSQRFSTPKTQESFDSAQSNQQNQYPINHNFPTSTAAPQYQDGQRFSTPGSGQTFGSPHGNQYGNQNYPTSTNAPQYQGQRITTPGQLFNQPSYPGSTAAPQYQQTFAPTPGINQQGVIPNQQDQFQRPVFNHQIPSSTAAPQGFIPGSQPQFGNNNIPSPGTNVAFPEPQGRPGGPIYGNIQQPTSQTGVGSSVFGAGAEVPSTTVGSLPVRDITSTPGGPIGGSRPERPQAEGDRNAEILNYENVLTPEGYFYTYDTSNGIHSDETGTVGNGTRAQGGYSYTGDDGKVYSVVYSADENGFQPRGDHLPTPPPIPEAIQRVIDQANIDKESGIDDDGSYNEQKYGYMKYEGPLTRLRPQNRTVSIVNGADIPDKKKTPKTKGRKPVSNVEKGEEFESLYEETDGNGSETDEIDENENRRVDNLENTKEKNRRPGSKPIETLTVEDNKQDKLKGMKMPLKQTTNSKAGPLQKNKAIERNGSDHRPISSEQNEDGASDHNTEESEDNDDSQESQDLDYDSDLVNYRDDPNNRTDFHGLNKYLPESKKTNRKNKPSKKRPTVRINETNQPSAVNEAKTPEDRKSQGFEGSRPDFVDETRTRIPSRKNQIGQRVKDQSKVTGQGVSDSDDETNSFGDVKTDTGEEYGSDDATELVNSDRVSKPGTTQSKKKIAGKPKRPNINESTDMSDRKEIKSASNEDNGYEYNPPQRKFGSEEAINLPSRVNQNGARTTLRPFLTKNVYGDETEPSDDYDGKYGAEKPGRGRPMTGQKHSGYNQDGNNYNQNNPKASVDGRFSTTRRPGTSRPFGRPETTDDSYTQTVPEVNEDVEFSTTKRPVLFETSRPLGRPQTTGNSYNQNNPKASVDERFSTTRRPGTSRPFVRTETTGNSYYQNYPEVNEEQRFSTTRKPVSYGTSRPFGRPQTTVDRYNQNNPEINDDERFSTTRRPVSYGTSRPFGRPQTTGTTPQYQEPGVTGQVYNEPFIQPQSPGDKLFYNTNAPNIGTGGNVFSSTTPLPSGPGYKYQRPGYQNMATGYDTTPGETYGANMLPGQVPSSTYRPNYSFGDKISSPVTVDDFGRPIQSTNAPTFENLRPTYSTGRPNESDKRPSDGEQFKPTDGRFGVTSTQGTPGYQSTSAPIREDFSGPKQPQRFDPETGYHYK